MPNFDGNGPSRTGQRRRCRKGRMMNDNSRIKFNKETVIISCGNSKIKSATDELNLIKVEKQTIESRLKALNERILELE
ncbi:MAG: hypothetical protein WCG23_03225 [bacterium]